MNGVRNILPIIWSICVIIILILAALVYYFIWPVNDPELDSDNTIEQKISPKSKTDSEQNDQPSNSPADEEPDIEPEPEPGPEPIPPAEPPEPEPEPPVEPPIDIDNNPIKSWTTLFYVAYDNSIGGTGIWESDRHFLEQIGSDENINLVALVDQEIDGDCELLIINEGSSKDYPTNIIDPEWNNELNTGDPDILNKFLKWGVEKFPANYYDFHIMDHGGGWLGACIDEPAGNTMIEASEFSSVMTDLKEQIGHKIDILSFDACFMASFEFSWEVADSVHFLTGMQTIAAGDNDGDYIRGNFEIESTWRGLKENPMWTPEEFASHQVNSFFKVGPYLMPSLGHTHPYSSDTMSSCDLDKMEPLKSSFSKLAQELYTSVSSENEAEAEQQLLQQVIGPSVAPPEQNTETFTGQSDFIGLGIYYFYDLGDFIARLAEYGSSLCITETAQEFIELFDDYVLNCVHGDDFKQGEHPDATGSDIYLPYRNGKYNLLYDDLRISRDTYWDEFLKAVPWVS